jgi:hypothetical protein
MGRRAVSASVYFVRAGGPAGPIKVGFTRNLAKRMESLQNGCPEELAVIHTVACGTVLAARDLERRLHVRFAALRIRSSEWFREDAAILAAIEELRAAPPDVVTEPSRPAGFGRKVVDVTVTQPWSRPLCSVCKQPIEDIERAYAAWYVLDGEPAERCFVMPMVVHQGRCCPRSWIPKYRIRLQDLPVEWLRRSPLDALHVAMRWYGDDADRLAWVSWLAVVLGLPSNHWDAISGLATSGEVAQVTVPRVFESHELRKAFGGDR